MDKTEARQPITSEDIYPEFAYNSAVSALAVVYASRQPKLVARAGGEPLGEEAQEYYLSRACRLIQAHNLPEDMVLDDAFAVLIEAANDFDIPVIELDLLAA